MLLVFLVLFVFGILGVQMFSGALRGACYSRTTGRFRETQYNCGALPCASGHDCLQLGQNPARGVYKFDDIGSSILTVFLVMTFEGCYDVIYSVQDSSSPYAWIFFLLCFMLGPIFAFQLFLAVISDKYSRITIDRRNEEAAEDVKKQRREKKRKALLQNRMQLSPEQTPAVVSGSAFGNARTLSPPPNTNLIPHLDQSLQSLQRSNTSILDQRKTPRNIPFTTRIKRQMLDFALSSGLHDVVMTMIVLNTLFMMIDAHVNLCGPEIPGDLYAVFRFDSDIFFDRAAEKSTIPVNRKVLSYKCVVEGSNLFFTLFFVTEVLVKVCSMGPKRFFVTDKDRNLNIFDVLVVGLGISEFPSVLENVRCLSAAENCYLAEMCGSAGVFYVMRCLRLVRLLKLVRMFPDAYKQLRAVAAALMSIGALLVLIVLFVIIFLILGMNLFGGSLTMEFNGSKLQIGSNVYVELPVDPWIHMRPPNMPGRRGVIVDVDPAKPDTPWQVELWLTEGMRKQLNLSACNPKDASDQDKWSKGVGCVWAAPKDEDIQNAATITGIVPRYNFDQPLYALITTFQILTMENWNDNLTDMYPNSGVSATIYLIVIIVVGNWILLNMMVAIIMQKFAAQRHEEVDAKLKAMKKRFVEDFSHMNPEELYAECLRLFNQSDDDGSGFIEKRELQHLLEKQVNLRLPEREFARLFNKYDRDNSGEIDLQEFLLMFQHLITSSKVDIEHTNETPLQQHIVLAEKSKETGQKETGQKETRRHSISSNESEKSKLHDDDRSCYLLSKSNPLRYFCSLITSHPLFERFILTCILFSCITLALDAPLMPQGDPIFHMLVVGNLLLNVIFIVECIMKFISQGILRYFSYFSSRLDFLIVVAAILDVILTNVLTSTQAVSTIKAIRVLRALRPLRLLSLADGIEGLIVLISAMFSSLKPIVATICIAFVGYSLLGLIGMQFLLGRMATCSDNTIKFMRDCWGTDHNGEPREWVRSAANFDFLPSAIITVFRICSLDNWPNIMWAATDAVGKVIQDSHSKYANVTGQAGPNEEVMSNQQMYSPGVFVYFFFTMISGTYILLNMFVSVFVDGYLNAAEQMKQAKPVTTLQIQPVYDDPRGTLRFVMHKAMDHSYFDLFNAFIIVTNVVLMSMESYKQASWQTDLAQISNNFFTLVFGWECLVKLYVYGGEQYFAGHWNKFDFFIVSISYIGVVIDGLGSSINLNLGVVLILRMFRIFRILRAFKVIKAAKGLQNLIFSLARSLPALANLSVMLMLIFFIFGALSCALYGTVCIEGEERLPGMGALRCALTGTMKIGLHWNFRHLGEALGTLFRVGITGDAWAEVLEMLGKGPANLVRPVSLLEWKSFQDLLGYDPLSLPASDVRYNAKLSSPSSVRMEMAKVAVRNWNASVFGMSDDVNWPTPVSKPEASKWLDFAQKTLSGCLTDEMVFDLEREGLLDCSYVTHNPDIFFLPNPRAGNRCQSSCALGGDWSFVITAIFFCMFILLTAFVCLQLVIAVLMDQLAATEDNMKLTQKVPQCEDLDMFVMNRIFRRFHLNARAQQFVQAKNTWALHGKRRHSRRLSQFSATSHDQSFDPLPSMPPSSVPVNPSSSSPHPTAQYAQQRQDERQNEMLVSQSAKAKTSRRPTLVADVVY